MLPHNKPIDITQEMVRVAWSHLDDAGEIPMESLGPSDSTIAGLLHAALASQGVSVQIAKGLRKVD